MTDVYLKKTVQGWKPVNEESKEISDSFSIGDVVKTKMTKPRNYEHHKKAFALFNAVLDNHHSYVTVDQVLDEIKFRLGYLDRFVIDGKACFKLKSISFASMGQEKFNTFYSKAIDVILLHMIPDTNPDDFTNYVLTFA